jgi:hypothetical protein
MRAAAILLSLVASTALAQGAPATKAPGAKPAEAKPAEGASGQNSTVIVRCSDDCTVKVDGKAGIRQATNSWEFKDVAPGQRRVEASGGFLNRPLYNGFADIPAGMKVLAQVDSNKRLTITERTPLGQVKEEKPATGDPSVLTVRCPKQCSVSIDGLRKGAANSQIVVVRDIPAGEHSVEVRFVLGSKVAQAKLNIPAASDVFATATESGLTITNSKPLGK